MDHLIYSALKQGALLPPLQPMLVQSRHAVYAVQLGGRGADAYTFMGLHFWPPDNREWFTGAAGGREVVSGLQSAIRQPAP